MKASVGSLLLVGLMGSLSSSDALGQSLSDGLVASYTFNGNAKDRSGYGNDGIVVTQGPYPRLCTDRHGLAVGAYEFGGYNYQNSYIRVPNSPSLQFSEAISVSMWIMLPSYGGMDGWGSYSESGAGFTFIAKAGDGNATRPGFFLNADIGTSIEGIHIGGNNANGNSHNVSLHTFDVGADYPSYQCGDWLHVAMVVEDYSAKLYFNGQLVDDREAKKFDFNRANNEDLYFGIMYPTWYPFKGKIDDVRIYNRPLYAYEVNQLYKNSTVLEQNTPVTSITIEDYPQTMRVGETAQIVASVLPSDATYKHLSWASNDKEVATVTKDGTVTALTPGTVSIRAKATDGTAITAKCTIDVLPVEEVKATLLAYKGHQGYFAARPKMNKVTADGSAELLVSIPNLSQTMSLAKPFRLEAYDENGNRLNATDNELGTLTLIQDPRTLEQVYSYTAPKDFCKTVFSTRYEVHIIGTNKSQEELHLATAYIYRPGLLLIHGLNSAGNSCFPTFATFLDNSYYHTMYELVDYKSSNRATFEYNTQTAKVVRSASETLYKRFLDEGIVSSSYDLVGHSMGGILSRLYVQEDTQVAENLKAKHHVHKIITVNTPHWGSNYGEIVRRAEFVLDGTLIVGAGLVGLGVDYIKNKMGDKYWHAINNLSPRSSAIAQMGDISKIQELKYIPCHSVCSYALPKSMGDEIVEEWNKYSYENVTTFSEHMAVSFHQFLQPMKIAVDMADLAAEMEVIFMIDDILGEAKHDFVVPLGSQMGRQSEDSRFVTIEPDYYEGLVGGNKCMAHHCNTTDWDVTHETLLRLLRLSVDDGCFSKTGFEPQPVFLPRAPRTTEQEEAPVLKPATSDTTYLKLKATRQIENDSVFVCLDIEHSGDIVQNMVVAGIDDENCFVSAGRSSYRFHVPYTYAGNLEFYGLGRTEDYQTVADTVQVCIEPLSSVVSIAFLEENINMFVGQQSKYLVKALWDNQQVSIVEPTLSSTNNQVVRIEDGIVVAVGGGECQLIADYGDYQCRVNVEVIRPEEEINAAEAIKSIRYADGAFGLYNAGNTLYITSDSDKETIYHVSVYDVTGCLQGGYTVASSSQTTAVELNIVKNHAYIIKVTTDQKEAVTRLYY